MGNVRDTDMGMHKISQLIKKLKKTTLKVGVFSEALNSEEGPSTYVAEYAIANEYGNEHIPERSFMRSTIDEKEKQWTKLVDDALAEAIQGKENFESELYKIGAIARRDIIEKIDSNINPPNSPSTIKKKGPHKNKTLVDHGVLRSSIEYRIN